MRSCILLLSVLLNSLASQLRNFFMMWIVPNSKYPIFSRIYFIRYNDDVGGELVLSVESLH